MNHDNPESPPAVAVVAVHGVADQEPATSARAVADLLVGLGGERYTSFVEAPRTLPTERPPVAAAPAAMEAPESRAADLLRRLLGRRVTDALRRLAGRFEERPELARRRAELAARRPEMEAVEEPDLLFMRDQLAAYESDGQPYRTVRLEGSRVDGGEVATRVHVYEMHWADLSRASTGALRLLGELYQLLLHLPNLGRQGLDMAELAHPGQRSWRWYARLHRWAVRLFTLLLPVLVVLSAAVLLVPLPGGLLPAEEPWGAGGPWQWVQGGLGVAVLALLVAVGTGYATRRLAARRRTAPLFLVAPYAAATVAVLVGWAALFPPVPVRSLLSGDQMLAAEGCVVALALVAALFAVYERLRPGALWTALACGLPTFGVFLVLAVQPAFRRGEALVDVSLWLFEVLLLLTLLASVTVYLLAFAAALCGSWLRLRSRGGPEGERVRRLNWTVRGTLALSVSLFLVVNLTFGSILNGTAGRFLPGAELAEQSPFAGSVLGAVSLAGVTGVPAVSVPRHEPAPVLPGFLRLADAAPPPEFLNRLLTKAATSGFLIILGLLALLALTLLSGLLPVVLAEIRPPRRGWGRGLAGEAWRRARRRRDDWAEEMGRSLSTVFPWVGRLVTLLFVCLVMVMPLVSLVDLVFGEAIVGLPALADWLDLASRANRAVLITTGSVVGAAVMALFLGGRLDALALGFRPFLDIALDVDNYLRQMPRRRTPRARMVERYTSLLHYLHRWRDQDGRPYRSLVLVAHSQGTVLSADVLAYLARERSPALGFADEGRRDDAPGLYLFTMGSPLRQLYALCFPYLYGWVADAGREVADEAGAGAATAMGDRQVVPTLPADATPDPAWLALRRWVNAYRSGDYVGRALWRDPARWPHLYRAAEPEAADGVVYTVSEDPAGRRRELCIGPGAHTHYWDATAPAIARELDLLISEAARGA